MSSILLREVNLPTYSFRFVNRRSAVFPEDICATHTRAYWIPYPLVFNRDPLFIYS